MSETKRFHIGDILSVTTGRLVSPDHIGGLYNLLGWMVDEDVMTHQLPRVARECEPFLREQFQDLASIDASGVTLTCEAEVITWLASLEPAYGTHRDVPRLDRIDHTEIDPVAEIKMIRPDVIIVGMEEA
jgi:hypothetical protein